MAVLVWLALLGIFATRNALRAPTDITVKSNVIVEEVNVIQSMDNVLVQLEVSVKMIALQVKMISGKHLPYFKFKKIYFG